MRRTKDEWTGIVESYKASGLTVRQFCRAENVGEQSLNIPVQTCHRFRS